MDSDSTSSALINNQYGYYKEMYMSKYKEIDESVDKDNLQIIKILCCEYSSARKQYFYSFSLVNFHEKNFVFSQHKNSSVMRVHQKN